MSLKLLHLSDIHFQKYTEDKLLDLDENLRREIEYDLELIKGSVGKIDLILVSGDIAYSGNENEYAKALKWLEKICSIVGCERENVLTVPGNHDVKRDEVDPLLEAAQQRFKKLPVNEIDQELKRYIENSTSWNHIQGPLSNYLQFAQTFGATPNKNSLFWEKDFPIRDCVLRIRGMNSTIISNKYDDKNSSKLILGNHQSTIIREKGVIYLTMCHHPPQWLCDCDSTEQNLVRARIQLFGHKHVFSRHVVGDSLLISAGAVHPDRNDIFWEPRYNVIELDIDINDSNKFLHVRLWKRIWKRDTQKFSSECTEEGSFYEDIKLRLDNIESSPIISTKKQDEKPMIVAMTGTNNKELNEIERIDTSIPNPKRKLAYMFLGLSYPKRTEIAFSLNLIEESDRNMSDFEKSRAYFLRADEKMILSQLWDKIIPYFPELKSVDNPFK